MRGITALVRGFALQRYVSCSSVALVALHCPQIVPPQTVAHVAHATALSGRKHIALSLGFTLQYCASNILLVVVALVRRCAVRLIVARYMARMTAFIILITVTTPSCCCRMSLHIRWHAVMFTLPAPLPLHLHATPCIALSSVLCWQIHCIWDGSVSSRCFGCRSASSPTIGHCCIPNL